MPFVLETISWFEPELQTLYQAANVNLRLHCTGNVPDSHDGSGPSSPDSGGDAAMTEKDIETANYLSITQQKTSKKGSMQQGTCCMSGPFHLPPSVNPRPAEHITHPVGRHVRYGQV
jgi:hypothetical protein